MAGHTLLPAELAAYAGGRPWEEFRDELGRIWRFRDEGSSTRPAALPLVLLPGAMGTSDVAWRIASAFRDERRVVSVTYPGDLKPVELAQGLLGLLRSRGIGKIALWGSSYGAWWAQAFAAQYPDRTAALWLGNTILEGADVAASPLFDAKWLHGAPTAEVIALWAEAVGRRPDDLLRRVQHYMLHEGLPAEDFHARLKNVSSARVLPVAGPRSHVAICDCDDDAIISPAVRKRVLMRYPAAVHVTLSGGGHYPHVLVPGQMVSHMQDWLRQADESMSAASRK